MRIIFETTIKINSNHQEGLTSFLKGDTHGFVNSLNNFKFSKYFYFVSQILIFNKNEINLNMPTKEFHEQF